MPVTIKCKWCHKKKEIRYPSWAKKGRGRFCNTVCVGKWNAKHRRGKNNPLWKGGPKSTRYTCVVCGKAFKARAARPRKVCSRQCNGGNLAEMYRTKHHPSFKGGPILRMYAYWAKCPEKKRAWLIAHHAIKTNRLVRGPCEFCGTKRDVLAHHDDYSKPLEVRWMCRADHTRYHAKEAMTAGRRWGPVPIRRNNETR